MNKVLTKLQAYVFLRVPLKERVVFFKQLAILMRSHIPLLAALGTLQNNARSRAMKKIIGAVSVEVEQGQSLGDALSPFKNSFGELAITIIAVGEMSGTLSKNLEYIALTVQKQQTVRRSVISALIYPLFIIVATIGMALVLTIFFFPKIIPLLKSVHGSLPLATRILIATSDALRLHGLLVAALVVGVLVALAVLVRIRAVGHGIDQLAVRIPGVRTVVQKYNMALICRTLGTLLASGMGISEAFYKTSSIITNSAYQKALGESGQRVQAGASVAASLVHYKRLFPALTCSLILVGENTGTLSTIFLDLATTCEQELDDLTKNISTTLEPCLLIFMGIVVGFVALAIITPIYGITQRLTPH